MVILDDDQENVLRALAENESERVNRQHDIVKDISTITMGKQFPKYINYDI